MPNPLEISSSLLCEMFLLLSDFMHTNCMFNTPFFQTLELSAYPIKIITSINE